MELLYITGLFTGIIFTSAFFVLFLRALVQNKYAIFEATPKLMELLHKNKSKRK